jgi:type IV pilus assembly protein PilC
MAIHINQLQKPPKKQKKSEAKTSDTFDFLNQDIKLFKPSLSDTFKEYMYDQLHVLISAGMDLKSSLQLLSIEAEKNFEKIILTKMLEELISGKSFSQCLASYSYFNQYEIQSIKIGEETGRLAYILKELAVYYSNKIKQRRQVISALTYPSVVFFVAISAVAFLLFFMVPMFEDVFKKFNRGLPFITRIILDVSHALQSYFYIIVFVFVFILTFLASQKNKIWFRSFFSKVVLATPILGEIVQKIYLVRFCKSMSLMISSKIPLVEAIRLSQKIIDFYPLQIAIEPMSDKLIKGEALHTALAEYKIFPNKLVIMIKVGEQVNRLDVFFEQIAKQYQEETDHKISTLSSLLEPALIVFLGVIVGIVLVAMYLPMFELSSVF